LQPDYCLPRPRWDRLTLNVLLSFAQFEREVTAERIRDKIGASKRKGLWGRRRGAP
jgi:DNA invertase Pin-like site-specific DNA recombinase